MSSSKPSWTWKKWKRLCKRENQEASKFWLSSPLWMALLSRASSAAWSFTLTSALRISKRSLRPTSTETTVKAFTLTAASKTSLQLHLSARRLRRWLKSPTHQTWSSFLTQHACTSARMRISWSSSSCRSLLLSTSPCKRKKSKNKKKLSLRLTHLQRRRSRGNR